jgi:signal peptidase II
MAENPQMGDDERRSAQHRLFWGLAAFVVGLDIATKAMAVSALSRGIPRDVVGSVVKLVLVYNPGAAFGLWFGPNSRWIFLGLTACALYVLAKLYRATVPGDMLRTVAIGLVCGGAIGNLFDRLRSSNGVVDFIDIGVGYHRWPTFNVADMAVTTGAILLAWVLWVEDRAPSRRAAPLPEM